MSQIVSTSSSKGRKAGDGPLLSLYSNFLTVLARRTHFRVGKKLTGRIYIFVLGGELNWHKNSRMLTANIFPRKPGQKLEYGNTHLKTAISRVSSD